MRGGMTWWSKGERADAAFLVFFCPRQIMEDMGCGTDDMKDCILNAGLDQNHAHLHLKVRPVVHLYLPWVSRCACAFSSCTS
jgi:hypothetical protein